MQGTITYLCPTDFDGDEGKGDSRCCLFMSRLGYQASGNEERGKGKEEWDSCHGKSPMQCLGKVETVSTLLPMRRRNPTRRKESRTPGKDKPNRQHLESADQAMSRDDVKRELAVVTKAISRKQRSQRQEGFFWALT